MMMPFDVAMLRIERRQGRVLTDADRAAHALVISEASAWRAKALARIKGCCSQLW